MDPLPARLDDLIDHVLQLQPDADALDHLRDAVLTSAQLGALADHLIGHFVDNARRAGASWTEIGQRLGVTKQAAQQRFVPRASSEPASDGRLFARFTERARGAVKHAPEHARRTGYAFVGTEHVLLGLLDEPGGLAARAISAQGVSLDTVRAAAAARLSTSDAAIEGHIPFGPATKKLLELTAREALRLGHNYIGTEHILLGLLRLEGDPGVQILRDSGVDTSRVELWLVRELAALAAARTTRREP